MTDRDLSLLPPDPDRLTAAQRDLIRKEAGTVRAANYRAAQAHDLLADLQRWRKGAGLDERRWDELIDLIGARLARLVAGSEVAGKLIADPHADDEGFILPENPP